MEATYFLLGGGCALIVLLLFRKQIKARRDVIIRSIKEYWSRRK